VSHSTIPALGGAFVVRKSITVPDDVLDASVRLAKSIGLEGVCEVEFRRDANDRPLLVEVNARLVRTLEKRTPGRHPLPAHDLAVGDWAANSAGELLPDPGQDAVAAWQPSLALGESLGNRSSG
jgi:hypothetical protein